MPQFVYVMCVSVHVREFKYVCVFKYGSVYVFKCVCEAIYVRMLKYVYMVCVYV